MVPARMDAAAHHREGGVLREGEAMPETVDQLIARASPEVQVLLQRLRGMVRGIAPDLDERFGWGQILYQREQRLGNFIVSLLPQRTYVNLEFIDGTMLPDPAGRLEGKGKHLRHVKIRTVTDVDD